MHIKFIIPNIVLTNTTNKMIINFNHTSEQHGIIEYYNVRGNSVKTYQLSQLEDWVLKNNLNVSKECKGGTGMVSDPNTDFEDKEIDLTDYIDQNWSKITEMFYHEMNN